MFEDLKIAIETQEETAKDKALITSVDFPEKCPECNNRLYARGCLITDFPYVHCDVQLNCSICNFKAVYGIPLDRVAGLALQIFDNKPLNTLTKAKSLKIPECPFHKAKMIMTKIFGDKVYNNRVVIQYKCPKCYLTAHLER